VARDDKQKPDYDGGLRPPQLAASFIRTKWREGAGLSPRPMSFDGMARPMTLGSPLVRSGFVGCQVPVDRCEHTGESGSAVDPATKFQ
jgi:hypothetical protein